MNVNCVQNITFESKVKYIPQETALNLGKLLRTMDKDTLKYTNGDFAYLHEVKSLTVPKEGSIKRGKYLAKRNKFDELIPYGDNTTMLEMNKARLIINNDTSKIIEYKKPFFMSWNNLFKKADLLIIEALNNYHNVDRVIRKVVQRKCLSELGTIKAQNELKPIFDFIHRMAGKNG